MATARKSTKSKSKRPKKTVRTASRVKRPATRKAPRATKARKPSAKASALRYAGVGSDAVLRATGRAWDEWLKILDRAGARAMPHKEIALLLSRKFAVPDWWSQMVTVGYEQARGLRKLYEKADGFSANASKTFVAPLTQIYSAWSDPALRARWLPEAPIEIRHSKDGKSMRITWSAGGSHVDVGFFNSTSGKSRVQVEHRRLPDTAAVLQQKKFWKEALERLGALLAPVTTSAP